MKKAKIVLVGSQHTGKTSLVTRFVRSDFTDHTIATTQPGFSQKTMNYKHRQISLEIWDTAGQERYHALSPLFYRDADAGIVVFDVTDLESFAKAGKWIDELKKERGDNVFILLAGNKIDLEQDRVIDKSEALKLAETVNAPYFETSAKSNQNVDALFNAICENITEKMDDITRGVDYTPKSLKTSIKFEEPTENSGCGC